MVGNVWLAPIVVLPCVWMWSVTGVSMALSPPALAVQVQTADASWRTLWRCADRSIGWALPRRLECFLKCALILDALYSSFSSPEFVQQASMFYWWLRLGGRQGRVVLKECWNLSARVFCEKGLWDLSSEWQRDSLSVPLNLRCSCRLKTSGPWV